MEKKIKGARRIGQMWHYNIRAPKRLLDAYDLRQTFPGYKSGFIRGTMRTKCSDEAERNVRAVLADLDRMEAKLDSISSRIEAFDDLSEAERDRLDDDLDVRFAKLHHDQKQLLKGEGGVWKAGQKLKQFRTQAAFLEAGAGSEYELKDMFGEEYDSEDRDDDEAQERFEITRAQKKADKFRKALEALGVLEPTNDAVTGLRALMEKYCAAKGFVDSAKVKDGTRKKYAYSVRRFIEYHGEIPLADLARKHLSDFAADFLRLPKSTRSDIRPLAFWDAVRAAERENLPRVIERTRDQNLTHLKTLMGFAVNEGDRDGPDPWTRYTPTVAKQKVSEKRKKKTYVFSRDEVKKIIARTSKTRDPNTVDYWGVYFGAYHGLRLEEVSQMRVADVVTEEGILCVKVTDEDELQKVKNENTFRTIPVHLDIVKLGFGDFVARRCEAGGVLLFMTAERWSGALSEIAMDGEGRYGSFYGSRFSYVLEKLQITGHRAGFHSFRNAWTDLARNAGIEPEKRRALAGRDSNAGGVRIDSVEDRYGHGFSIKVLFEALNKLKPLVD